MPMTRCFGSKLLAALLVGLLASLAAAGEPAKDSGQPRDTTGRADTVASQVAPLAPASAPAAVQPPGESDHSSPMPTKGERPKHGLCDGS
jgi:hypothetical protein